MVKHEEILKELSNRGVWDDRQRMWYAMRHDGLRRRNKPWPNAADMHFPLGDTLIEKLKPYYIQQIYAADTVATFSPLQAGMSEYAAGAAQWFDHQLKQKSNFEFEMVAGVDAMLMSGKCPVKLYWDADAAKEIRFDAIDPRYLIVPAATKTLREADWIVHVQRLPEAESRRTTEYRQEEEFIARIKGKQAGRTDSEKDQREGITCAASDSEIVVWEVISRNTEGTGWEVQTYFPALPNEPVRPTFALPYSEGAFKRGLPPYGEISAEVKDKGYFSARGVMEKIAPFEASLCKDWNTQKDYQTLTCSPIFAGKGIPEGTNLRMIPGQILPYEIAAVTFPPMPMDLQQQMIGTRMVAEQLVGTPDFGAAQQTNTSRPRTATEMSMAGAMMSQNVDLRARIFRRELGHILQLAWSLLIQYKREELSYYYRDELMELDGNALVDAYQIEPSGSGDNLNKPLLLQKAMSRMQMFNNDPMIEQRELRRSVIEADDPRLVKRLLLDQGTQQAAQLEDQAQEISILLINFPAQVKPTDDDEIHLQAITGYAQRKLQMSEVLHPEQWLMLATHAQGHLGQWKKKNAPNYAQRGGEYVQFWTQAQQQAQQIMQQMQAQQQAAQPQVAGGAR